MEYALHDPSFRTDIVSIPCLSCFGMLPQCQARWKEHSALEKLVSNRSAWGHRRLFVIEQHTEGQEILVALIFIFRRLQWRRS